MLQTREDVPYPVADQIFLNMRKSHDFTDNILHSYAKPSDEILLVQKIRLNGLLFDIAKLNRDTIDGVMTSYTIQTVTEQLGDRLDEWQLSLPHSLLDTPENLAAQVALGFGGQFVSLHIGFYHFSQLLYYRYLHQSQLMDVISHTSTDKIQNYAEKCRLNSTFLCELVYSAQCLPGAEVYVSSANIPCTASLR